MRVPFLSNRVGDMIIYALRSGGYLADDASADSIRSISNDASESDMLNLAVTLNYGSTGGGGSGGLSSTEDVYAIVDSDNSNATTPYTNYFRVIKGQETTPVTDPFRDLYAIGSESGPDSDTTVCRIGPDTALMAASQEFSGRLTLGADYNGASAEPTLTLLGRTAGGSEIDSLYQLEVKSSNSGLTLRAKDYITFEPFNVASTEGIRMKADPVADTVTMELPHSFTEHALIFGSNMGDWRMLCAIGGRSGVQHYDPSNLLIGAGYPGFYGNAYNLASAHTSSLHVVAPDQDHRCVLSTWHKGTNGTLAAGTHLVNFHSQVNFQASDPTVRLFSVTGFEGSNRQVAFEVRADRSCYGVAFTSTGQDIAETFPTDVPASEIEPGTVVIIGPTGKAEASALPADVAVLGVVSTQPGMLLGGPMPEEDLGNVVSVAMSGTVPVRCITSRGSISPGDLLVSASGGRAQKAAADDPPGSKFGKALEALEQPEDDIVTGTIKMLVFNG